MDGSAPPRAVSRPTIPPPGSPGTRAVRTTRALGNRGSAASQTIPALVLLTLCLLAHPASAAERFYLQCWIVQTEWDGFVEPSQGIFNLEVSIAKNRRVTIHYPQAIACERFSGSAGSTTISASCTSRLYRTEDVTMLELNRLDGSFRIASGYAGERAPYAVHAGYCRRVERLF